MDNFCSVPKEKIFTSEIEINKSRFLGFAKYVDSVEDAQSFVKYLRQEYKDARHVVYGYIVNNAQKSSDDGEPSGTAGRPILGLLLCKNCEYIVVAVVRYFGGTKLGAGRLLRAYQKAVQDVLEPNLVPYLKGRKYQISLSFSEYQPFLQTIKNKRIKVIKTEYCDKVILNLLCFDEFEHQNMQFLGEEFGTLGGENANN